MHFEELKVKNSNSKCVKSTPDHETCLRYTHVKTHIINITDYSDN